MRNRNENSKTKTEMRNTEIESHKIEVDNGVHPLHWATSPGPSPMGTDPINGFKGYKMVLASTLALAETKSAFAETECWTGSLQDLLSGTYNLDFKR